MDQPNPLSRLGIVVLVLIQGCSEGPIPTFPIQGRVVFADGKPLAGGRIELQSVEPVRDGKRVTARGIVAEDGTFGELSTFESGDGAVAGEHRVMVAPQRTRGEGGPMFVASIDRKFLNYHTSGLIITVAADGAMNEFEIQVTPPSAR